MLSGPMFEPAKSEDWNSVFKKQGAHYNVYGVAGGGDERGMRILRKFFGDAAEKVNEMNLVLFSTSGVHGTHRTIEDAEAELQTPAEGDEEDNDPSVTFLILQPRIVCTRYGNCNPENQADIDYLKLLRARSLEAFKTIGYPEAQP